MVIFRYINGKIRPIEVGEEQTTNDYMNDKLRNTSKRGKIDEQQEYKIYETNEDIVNDWYHEYKQIFKEMEIKDPETWDAFQKYTFVAGDLMNKKSLGINIDQKASKSYQERLQNWTEKMDAEINRHTFKENTIVWRGAKTEYFEKYKSGDIIEYKMFNSTSLSRNAAEDFVKRKNYGYDSNQNFISNSGRGTLLEIRCKKGNHGIYTGNFFHPFNEHEVILPRTAKYKYIKNYKRDSKYLGYAENVIVLEMIE